MRLSVIIVSYNVRHFLDLCLHSVQQAAGGQEAEIIVVDNASADDSVAWVEAHFPDVKIIANKTNTGFSRANNQGVEIATGKYVLFLNPDTVMPEDFFSKTLEYLDAHPEAGALGPRLIDGKGAFAPDAKKGFPTFAIAFFKTTGLHRLFPKSTLFNGYYAPQVGEWETAPVEVLSGCCMLVRRQVIDAVGGAFDERFFMYCEDVDLSYRIVEGGWQNIYFPPATLVHYKGESTRKATISYIRVFNEALAAFVRKHYSRRSARIFVLLLHLGIAARAALGVIRAVFKRLKLPLLDALILLVSLWAIQVFWVDYVKGVPPVSARLLVLTYPVYLAAWVSALYLNGAYDPTYRPLRVVRGMLMGTIGALAFYGLLPPEMRYSRGMIVFGGMAGTVALLGIHAVLQRWGVTGQVAFDQTTHDAVVVGGAAEAAATCRLLQKWRGAPRIIGRVGEEGIAPLEELKPLLQLTGAGEVIFAAGSVPYTQILAAMQQCGPRYDYKIHLPDRSGFVGSNSSKTAGDLYGTDPRYRLSDPALRRQKRTFDVLGALLLLLFSPLWIWGMQDKAGALRALGAVLTGSKTFVGYAGRGAGLPAVRPCLMPPGQLAAGYVPAAEVADAVDSAYALHYTPGRDWALLWRNGSSLRKKTF